MLHTLLTRIALVMVLLLASSCSASSEQGKLSVAPAQPETMRLMNPADLGSGFNKGTVMQVGEETTVYHNGKAVKARVVTNQNYGLMVPDQAGGYYVIPSTGRTMPHQNVVNARELKLQMRELAAQLVAGMPPVYSGFVALPTSFVMQDNFDRTSSFGRFAAEQMYYELNQRGMNTREYRMSDRLQMREDGEFILLRKDKKQALASNTLYLAGTYYSDNHAIFVTAKLLRSNGQIVRTGQVILAANDLTRRMLANSGMKMQEGSIDLRDFDTEARPPSNVTVFDTGLDIH